MITIIACLVGGVLAGYLLRRFSIVKIVKKLPMLFIFLLLFSLGITVGSNSFIINNLATIGLQSLIITSAAILGSVVMASIIYNSYFKAEEHNEK